METKYLCIVLVLLLTIGILFVSGCGKPVYFGNESNASQGDNQNNQQSGDQVQETKVQTIGDVYFLAKNWDSDSEVDGLEFDLNPKDKDDSLVMTDGKVSIKLWKIVQQGYENKCLKRNEDLLESWDNIQVKKGDYSIFGVTVRAEYKSYEITDDKYALGCAEVVFTTPDGKNFTSSEDTIFINGL
ncbi:MAG: hypothetical protein IB618_04135 [Candidatus Pacearchaeota archaeon]|nr:MAG: hypothetical protein IB618_04135 [Candidatus Pacearchaeota archaeon]